MAVMAAEAVYGPPSTEKALGALPVVRDFLARLDVAGTVDRLCPMGPGARISDGQVVEALIANRLTSPAPLVRITDWAAGWAVEEVLGIPPDALNDDPAPRGASPYPRRSREELGRRFLGPMAYLDPKGDGGQ